MAKMAKPWHSPRLPEPSWKLLVPRFHQDGSRWPRVNKIGPILLQVCSNHVQESFRMAQRCSRWFNTYAHHCSKHGTIHRQTALPRLRPSATLPAAASATANAAVTVVLKLPPDGGHPKAISTKQEPTTKVTLDCERPSWGYVGTIQGQFA